MNMKSLFKILPLLGIAFVSCNDMNEVYDSLDNKYDTIPYNESITYTLTANDYKTAQSYALKDALDKTDSTLAKLLGTNLAFNSRFTASDYIGYVLATDFPALKKNSSAVVNYNDDEGLLLHTVKMMSAPEYIVNKDDYNLAGGVMKANRCFFAAYPAEKSMPVILDSAFANEKVNDVVFVQYNYSTEAPRSGNEIDEVDAINFGFDFDLGSFNALSVLGDQKWIWDKYDNGCAKMNGYSGGPVPNEDWLISPEIDLSDFSDSKVQISQAYNYLKGVTELCQVKISANNTEGNNGDWETLNFETVPLNDGWDFITSEFYDISAYDGQIVKIAFVYKTNDTVAATWEIGKLQVTGYGPVLSKSSPVYNYYLYDGISWKYYPGSLTLQPSDYEVFPGPSATRAFSSTYPAKNYLPKFLSDKYPYAQAGDTLLISYKYGSKRTVERYQYTVSATTNLLTWSAYNTILSKTDQFRHTGDAWFFDPTVRKTMGAVELQKIVNYVKENVDPKYVDSYGTGEFYYGASAYYKNFDLRISKRTANPDFTGKTETEQVALTWQLLEEALIKYLGIDYPLAVPEVKGIKVYYWLTFNTFENDYSKKTYIGCFKCTSAGTNPVFESDLEMEDATYGKSDDTKKMINWNR